MVPHRDKVAQRFIMAIFVFTSVAALGQTYCGLADDGSTVLTPSNYSTFTAPSLGSSYTEEFGSANACTISRVTDESQTGNTQSVTSHYYATQNPFNSDDSLLMVLSAGGTPYIVRRTDGSVVVSSQNMPPASAGINVWSTSNPAEFFSGNGANLFKAVIGGTNCTDASNWSGAPNCTVTTTTLCTSSALTNLQFNENDISYDGLHMWLANAYQDSGAASVQLFTLNATDPSSCTAGATVTVSGGYHKLGILPNNYLFMEPSSGTDTVYDTSGKVFTTLNTGGGHTDFGYDISSGKVVGIGMWNQGTAANGCSSQYGIGVYDLQPGDPLGSVVRCLSEPCPNAWDCSNGGGYGGHISYRDTSAGWVVIETQSAGTNCPSGTGRDCFNSVQPPDNWDYRAEEIVAFKEDGSQTLRLAHYRSRTGGSGGAYWSQPRPVISRDGKYIAFDSNYDNSKVIGGNTGDGTVNVFVIPFQLGSDPPPPNPPTALSAIVQ